MARGRTVEGNRAAALAKATGAIRYSTGLPCSHGHVAERQTSNGTCIECVRLRSLKAHHGKDYEVARRAHKAADTVFAAYRRQQKAEAERLRRQRPEVKAARRAERMKRICDKKQRTPAWAELSGIRNLYAIAAKLGKAWHVDHEIPLNGEKVSGLHVLGNLRIIRAQENLLKGASFA